MRVYTTKATSFAGTSYKEIRKKAYGLYQEIKRKSKRKPYVRSAFFKKEKIRLQAKNSLSLFFQLINGNEKRKRPSASCGL